jgi:flagellin
MAQVINTNIPSLTAQRSLGKTQGDVATALQRLGSGLRINSAKDDAAGLAISERFTSQIRGLNQAVRNANDGISLAQTAEGDLGTIGNNLQRIRELAVQSANATNSQSDRNALQSEVAELISEIDRIAVQSNFNGVSLLDGTFSDQVFQVGANAGQTITVSQFDSARTDAIGQAQRFSSGALAVVDAVAAGELTVNGNAVAATTANAQTDEVILSQSLAGDIAAAIEAADSSVSVTVGAAELNLGAFTDVTGASTAPGATYSLEVEGITIISDATVATGNSVTDAEVDAALTPAKLAELAAVGVTVKEGTTAAGNDLTFVKADGSDLNITETLTTVGANVVAGGFTATTAGAQGEAFGTIELVSDSAIAIGGTAPTNVASGLTGTFATQQTTGTLISDISVSTFTGANAAITAVDNALTTVNSSRASLGAIQNRFESVVTSLQTSSENLDAARSRIRDADFAAETASLARAQVLQQAGITVLAQANAQTQNVLALLQ